MTAPLIGRGSELEFLRSFVDQAAVRGGALLVWGEAGVGKTVLLDATAAHAAATGRSTWRAWSWPTVSGCEDFTPTAIRVAIYARRSRFSSGSAPSPGWCEPVRSCGPPACPSGRQATPALHRSHLSSGKSPRLRRLV